MPTIAILFRVTKVGRDLLAGIRVAPFAVRDLPTPYIGYAAELSAAVAALTMACGEGATDIGCQWARPWLIGGPPGSGVSTFLLAVAHAAKRTAAFEGGIFSVDLRGTKDVATGFSEVCSRLGVRVLGSALEAFRKWSHKQASAGAVLLASA